MKNKLLSVKEFDLITDNTDYQHNHEPNIHYVAKEVFQALDKLVRQQNFAVEENGALDFFKIYSKKGIGNVIQAKNYVGLIQLENGYQVQILPKIDMVDENDERHSTLHIFIDMLKCLKNFPGKKFSTANLRTEHMNLYEIFISMYVIQVAELIKRGIKSSYVQIEDNRRVLKGKLIFKEQLRKNIAHAERFYVSFYEYSPNRPENKIIKSTLLKLQKVSTSSNNIKAIKKQLMFFEMVEPSTNYNKDFSQVALDRTMQGYNDVIAWSRVFLSNMSFSVFSGNDKATALLFPMEKLYEVYVAHHIARLCCRDNIEVVTQDSGKYLFKEGERKVFSLRPDIVLRDKNEHTIIMDTKWKCLSNSPNQNYGISQSDMYQMFAYSKKYNAKYIWLLYPDIESLKNHAPIIFCDGNETEVHIFFVNIAHIEDSMKELLKKVKDQFGKLGKL